MKRHTSNIHCPTCQEILKPKILECTACDLRVEGPFELNEFASLSSDDLHFLRIFIHCEGRVRDMEPALGLSYPTIRNRIAELKSKLNSSELAAEPVANKGTAKAKEVSAAEALQLLEQGKISFEEAQKLIRGNQ